MQKILIAIFFLSFIIQGCSQEQEQKYTFGSFKIEFDAKSGFEPTEIIEENKVDFETLDPEVKTQVLTTINKIEGAYRGRIKISNKLDRNVYPDASKLLVDISGPYEKVYAKTSTKREAYQANSPWVDDVYYYNFSSTDTAGLYRCEYSITGKFDQQKKKYVDEAESLVVNSKLLNDCLNVDGMKCQWEGFEAQGDSILYREKPTQKEWWYFENGLLQKKHSIFYTWETRNAKEKEVQSDLWHHYTYDQNSQLILTTESGINSGKEIEPKPYPAFFNAQGFNVYKSLVVDFYKRKEGELVALIKSKNGLTKEIVFDQKYNWIRIYKAGEKPSSIRRHIVYKEE